MMTKNALRVVAVLLVGVAVVAEAQPTIEVSASSTTRNSLTDNYFSRTGGDVTNLVIIILMPLQCAARVVWCS